MSYFSRLTEIVTCNISELLTQSDDPKRAIGQIIAEIEEGLSGARRSAATAAANEDRVSREIAEQRAQAEAWSNKAREQLRGQRDSEARQSLMRKREVDDLIAGLQQQHQAAAATREHLSTMQRAMEARLADALRKRAALESDTAEAAVESSAPEAICMADQRSSEVDAELEALRRELGVER